MDTWITSTFWLLWIVLLWKCTNNLIEPLLSTLSGIYTKVELLPNILILCLVFWETAILFSTEPAPFYTTTSSAQGFSALHILTKTIFHFFNYNHPSRWEESILLGLWFAFSWWLWCIERLLLTGYLYIFFGEMPIQMLFSFLNWLSFLLLSCRGFFGVC